MTEIINIRRAFILDQSNNQYSERPFLEIKKGDIFYVCEADGTRVEPGVIRVADDDSFTDEGGVYGVMCSVHSAVDAQHIPEEPELPIQGCPNA
ncbi:MAG: hypothetical protein ACN6OP_10375 [Pseudomonadales bacterium]